MECKSLEVLERFKASFLQRFEGTDEGDVTTYLGGELIRDRAASLSASLSMLERSCRSTMRGTSWP
eukprot:188869-Rhodomonas_salina.2